jgi:hypothetical protein
MKATINIVKTITFGAMLCAPLNLFAVPAFAGDYFGRSTPQQAHVQKSASQLTTTTTHNATIATPADWFAKYDEAQAKLRPSSADRVILSRPFNQELERVQSWIGTAKKVAKNYRSLSRITATLPVPQGTHGIKEYRDLMSEWYLDAASIYEDLTRPCHPARTMEELEGQLAEIKARAQSIGQSHANLASMDTNIRQKYNVTPADDALAQYVSEK